MPALVAALALVLAAAALPPAPTRWVEDRVGAMSAPARRSLDARLEAYQRDTGHQVVVWIGDTIGEAALDDWAVRTFAAWRVGRAGVDDGLVVFVLMADRAIDIEVGYGLEDRVPDATAARVIREVMSPALRAGQVDRAITTGVDALLAAIEGRPDAGTGTTGPPAREAPSLLSLIVGAIAVLGFLALLVTNPRLALLLLWTMAGRGGGGGGGGWAGGGGGGFSGGGGRSGGGGARGRW